ncbi:MAG: universal stress protein [Rhizonema sp. PD37]|nr:universal stress protein [Rhizonema sp. PD37]
MLKTILVALDDSEITDRVIQTVQQLLLNQDSTVILCHVLLTPSQIDLPADRPNPELPALSSMQVEKQLQDYQAQLSVKSQLEMVTGDPPQEIIRLANIHKADLIVIGSRELTGMNRIVQGSVSSEVVAEAPCSVLVVKPK